jgi:putative phosphoesterase
MPRHGSSTTAAQEPGMLIGVISDTHGNTHSTQHAVRILESFQVEQVLHCGDIGSPAVVELLDRWPAHFVWGNTDHDRRAIEEAIASTGQTCHGSLGELELAGRRIALLHGDDERRLRQAIAGEQFDLVCHGHTHAVRRDRVGRTLVLNPGALHRAHPRTLAIVELKGLEATIVTVGPDLP